MEERQLQQSASTVSPSIPSSKPTSGLSAAFPSGSSASTSSSSTAAISQGALIGAVLIPVVLVATLMVMFILCKRRKRTTSRRGGRQLPPPLPVSNQTSSAATPRTTAQRFDHWIYATLQRLTSPAAANNDTSSSGQQGMHVVGTEPRSNSRTNNDESGTNNNNNNSNRRGRRGRRERLRRTDSGGTVKTLPEYNELGEDEIMLYKAEDSSVDIMNETSVQDEEEGLHELQPRGGENNNNYNQRRSPSRNSGRHSSLSSVAGVLRRLSQRRSDSNGVESNELHTVTQRGDEMTEMIPEEDAPDYDNLYPTLPPQIEVHDEEGEADAEANEQQPAAAHPPTTGRRRAALNSIFRRPAGGGQENHHRRIASATSVPSANDLNLSMTRSNDLSLYRPSTSSSSRRLFSTGFLNNGSSASLLSLTQSGNEANDSPGQSSLNLNRQHHARNISAPISTRRLQFAPPVAGFSDQQMQFLTSVESLDRYGIPLEQQEAAVPPSFEQLARDEERRAQADAVINSHTAPVLTTAEVQRQQLQDSDPAAGLPRTLPQGVTTPESGPPTTDVS